MADNLKFENTSGLNSFIVSSIFVFPLPHSFPNAENLFVISCLVLDEIYDSKILFSTTLAVNKFQKNSQNDSGGEGKNFQFCPNS